MADISRQSVKNRLFLALSTPAYLRDHCFEGKAVYPAVEAMITLAKAVKNAYPQAALHAITDAQFPRMLTIEPQGDHQDVLVDLEWSENAIGASLLTLVKIKRGQMSRALAHARVSFDQRVAGSCPPLSAGALQRLEGDCIQVPAATVYRELIPFGPSYQNLTGDLAVSVDGVLAEISGGGGDADDSLLGSPYVMDAAMHAACVWGQRFAGLVALPVGFDRRRIDVPVKKGGNYQARIKPVEAGRETLVFDVWIFDPRGIMCEIISGLRMRDVTGGRLRPPRWIRDTIWEPSS